MKQVQYNIYSYLLKSNPRSSIEHLHATLWISLMFILNPPFDTGITVTWQSPSPLVHPSSFPCIGSEGDIVSGVSLLRGTLEGLFSCTPPPSLLCQTLCNILPNPEDYTNTLLSSQENFV